LEKDTILYRSRKAKKWAPKDIQNPLGAFIGAFSGNPFSSITPKG
jgi:hypothetical protein